MSYQEKDVDILELFETVTKYSPGLPNSFPLNFELDSLKELFEFLLQFLTMICKEKYGNEKGQVNLAGMLPEEFDIVNKYMQSIGFTCNFNIVPAIAHNINNTYEKRYDRIIISQTTKLCDMLFGIKCDDILYVISFEPI